MDLGRLTDDELLAATPSRPQAVGEFYARHEAAILGLMLRRTGDPELAADLAAEAFAAALVSVRRYRPGPAPAAAWLYGIARHVLLRSAERRRVEDRARRRLDMTPLAITDEVLERIERHGRRRAPTRCPTASRSRPPARRARRSTPTARGCCSSAARAVSTPWGRAAPTVGKSATSCVLRFVGELQDQGSCSDIGENPALGGTVTYVLVPVDGAAAVAALAADDISELELEFGDGRREAHRFVDGALLVPVAPWPTGLHWMNDAGIASYAELA